MSYFCTSGDRIMQIICRVAQSKKDAIYGYEDTGNMLRNILYENKHSRISPGRLKIFYFFAVNGK